MMVMMMKPPAKAAPNEVYEKDYGKSPIYIPVTAAQTFDPIWKVITNFVPLWNLQHQDGSPVV